MKNPRNVVVAWKDERFPHLLSPHPHIDILPEISLLTHTHDFKSTKMEQTVRNGQMAARDVRGSEEKYLIQGLVDDPTHHA
jgi:hypothetical protein